MKGCLNFFKQKISAVFSRSQTLKKQERGSVYTELVFVALLGSIIAVPIANNISPLLSDLDRDTDVRQAFQGVAGIPIEVDFFDYSGDIRENFNINLQGQDGWETVYDDLRNLSITLRNQTLTAEEYCAVAYVVNEHVPGEAPRLLGSASSSSPDGATMSVSGAAISELTDGLDVCQQGWNEAAISHIKDAMIAGVGDRKHMVAAFPLKNPEFFSKYLTTYPDWE